MGGHNLAPDMSGMATIQGKSMLGAQPVSGRSSAPAYGFGSGTRQHQSKLYIGPEAAKTASVSISPGACYESPDAVGKQADGGKNSQPEWRFGTQERFAGRVRSKTPGPGCEPTPHAHTLSSVILCVPAPPWLQAISSLCCTLPPHVHHPAAASPSGSSQLAAP